MVKCAIVHAYAQRKNLAALALSRDFLRKCKLLLAILELASRTFGHSFFTLLLLLLFIVWRQASALFLSFK